MCFVCEIRWPRTVSETVRKRVRHGMTGVEPGFAQTFLADQRRLIGTPTAVPNLTANPN